MFLLVLCLPFAMFIGAYWCLIAAPKSTRGESPRVWLFAALLLVAPTILILIPHLVGDLPFGA